MKSNTKFPSTRWIWTAFAVLAGLVLGPLPGWADDLSVGSKFEGRVDVEFLGEIVEVRSGKNGGYRATVQIRGTFANGLPFQGNGEVQIGTQKTVVVGDPVRGRLLGEVRGQITDRSASGLRLRLDGDLLRVRWLTPQAFGGGSKGGGTNIFRIDAEVLLAELTGLAAGAPVQGLAEGRFLGEIVGPGSAADTYLAVVALEGGFLSGVPYQGTTTIEITSTDPLQAGDAVRGRLQAQMLGSVTEVGDSGVSIDVDLLPLNTDWETLNFGGASKGGGTNVFKLEGGLVLGFGGASKTGGTNV